MLCVSARLAAGAHVREAGEATFTAGQGFGYCLPLAMVQ